MLTTVLLNRSGARFKLLKTLSNLSRCLTSSETAWQLKVPDLPKSKKVKKNNANARIDLENELLYGPLLKPCKNSSEHKIGLNCDEVPIATEQRYLHGDISGNQKVRVLPSSGTRQHVLDSDKEQQTSSAASTPLKIPYGNFVNFPLETYEKTDECLQAAARELISTHDVDSTKSIASASVTSVLQRTMSPESAAALDRWRRQMIAKLGPQGFAKYQEDTFQTGAALHKSIHDFLKGQPTPDSQMDPRIFGHWKSILPVLKEISNVVSLEDKLTHPYLRYHGIADCVAQHRNKLVLIEWKTSQKPKPLLRYTYDNPLQVAAYMGAFNASSSDHTQLNCGIIVVCYPDGSPAHTHILDPQLSQKAWESWLLRLRQFWQFQKQTNQGTTES